MLNFPVPPVSRFVATASVGSSGAFSDSGVSDFHEKLSVEEFYPFGVAPEHLYQGVFDVGQGGDIAQIDGVEFRAPNRVGHHPAHQVAEQQMGVDFLGDTGGRVRTEVLDVKAMLPFSIDRLNLPAAMVEIDEFAVEMNLRIEQ